MGRRCRASSRSPPGFGSRATSAARKSAGQRPQASASAVPALAELIGSKAKEVLDGGSPYRSSEGAGVDRSAQLTGFVKEVYSWVNLLNQEGLNYGGSPDELIQQAVTALAIEDKWDRVLATIDQGDCRHHDADVALRRYRRLIGGACGRRSPIESASAPAAAAAQIKPTLQQVLEKLAEEGLSGSELSFRVERIAGDEAPEDVSGAALRGEFVETGLEHPV